MALNQGLKKLVASAGIPKSLDVRVRPLGGGLTIAGSFFRCRSDHVEITDQKFRAKFTRIPPTGASYDLVALSTALYSRPIWGRPDWAVYGVRGLMKDRILASNSLIRRAILDDSKYLISFLRHIRTIGVAVCVIEGPRPFRHNTEVDRAGVELVRFIDAMYRSLTLEVLFREDIPVVSVPRSLYDEDGFMLEAYRHHNPKDKTHGSAEFGRIMMLELIRFVQRQDTTEEKCLDR